MRVNLANMYVYLSLDLWTSLIVSPSGYKFYLIVVDYYSHYFWAFPLRFKSEVHDMLIAFVAYVQNQFQSSVGSFQSDNGREFVNHINVDFFHQHGIFLQLSCPHTS